MNIIKHIYYKKVTKKIHVNYTDKCLMIFFSWFASWKAKGDIYYENDNILYIDYNEYTVKTVLSFLSALMMSIISCNRQHRIFDKYQDHGHVLAHWSGADYYGGNRVVIPLHDFRVIFEEMVT